MSPTYLIPLTQLEMKALWVHGFATADLPIPGMNDALTDAFLTGLRKLQDASHLHFTEPSLCDM